MRLGFALISNFFKHFQNLHCKSLTKIVTYCIQRIAAKVILRKKYFHIKQETRSNTLKRKQQFSRNHYKYIC